MPTSVLIYTLTDKGRKTAKERPDRIREVNQELEGRRRGWSVTPHEAPARALGGCGVQILPP